MNFFNVKSPETISFANLALGFVLFASFIHFAMLLNLYQIEKIKHAIKPSDLKGREDIESLETAWTYIYIAMCVMFFLGFIIMYAIYKKTDQRNSEKFPSRENVDVSVILSDVFSKEYLKKQMTEMTNNNVLMMDEKSQEKYITV